MQIYFCENSIFSLKNSVLIGNINFLMVKYVIYITTKETHEYCKSFVVGRIPMNNYSILEDNIDNFFWNNNRFFYRFTF